MVWKETERKEEKQMLKLIKITYFSGWTKQQVTDFILGMILTIVLMHIFG